MKMKKKITNIHLTKLKRSAMQLRMQYQLPYYLVYIIRNLDVDNDKRTFEFLKTYTEHALRCVGYYHKYSDYNDRCDDELKQYFIVENGKVVDKRLRKE